MAEFRFFHPVDVRYADVDAQRHVNNVAFFTYMEQARARYLVHLGLWDGQDFTAIGIIIAEASCAYRAPINFGQAVQVGVRASRLGSKSLTLDYRIEDPQTAAVFATGRTVLVAYNYGAGRSIRLPDTWRESIARFEDL
jgi:acyl-CoA thioester hydrolase